MLMVAGLVVGTGGIGRILDDKLVSFMRYLSSV